ncbi:Pre-rRNA-processing protein ipi3 [Ptychographa xylographoides]|nr:Pre-rRNA-processing protein ipi3 [Ptychographa xylographoides]
MIDFYKRSSLIHEIYDSNIRTIPIQPSPADRWSLAGEATSAAYCLDTSYDGTTLVSGHQNGTLHAWDTAKGRYGNQVSDLFSSVMNLHLLPPSGFPNQDPPNARLLNVVKPRYESSLTSNNMSVSGSGIPENYTFTAQFASMIRRPLAAHDLSLSFERALDHASFPDEFFEEGLTELAIWSNASESKTGASTTSGPPDDLQKEIARLKVQLRFEKSSKQVYMVRTVELGDELRRRDNVERNKRRMKKLGRLKRANMETERRNTEMGTVTREGESVMDTGGDDKEAMNEEYSSSTEELTGSELGR